MNGKHWVILLPFGTTLCNRCCHNCGSLVGLCCWNPLPRANGITRLIYPDVYNINCILYYTVYILQTHGKTTKTCWIFEVPAGQKKDENTIYDSYFANDKCLELESSTAPQTLHSPASRAEEAPKKCRAAKGALRLCTAASPVELHRKTRSFVTWKVKSTDRCSMVIIWHAQTRKVMHLQYLFFH